MAIYTHLAICLLCLIISAAAEAADFMTSRRECAKLHGSAVEKPEQRFDITAKGFSILPPQGERWCYRLLKTSGVSFFKVPTFKNTVEGRPSRDEVRKSHLFSAIAMSLEGFVDDRTGMRKFDELTIPVKRWLSEHLFAQIQMGIATANHRFRLLASTVAAASYSGATCAKFDATVEELGSPLDADSVFLLQFSGNLVCRHPLAPEIGVVWIGFVERYPEGDQPISENIKREYEPHVQSLQFMLPH